MTSEYPSYLKIQCCFYWLLIRNYITYYEYVYENQDLSVLCGFVGSITAIVDASRNACRTLSHKQMHHSRPNLIISLISGDPFWLLETDKSTPV